MRGIRLLKLAKYYELAVLGSLDSLEVLEAPLEDRLLGTKEVGSGKDYSIFNKLFEEDRRLYNYFETIYYSIPPKSRKNVGIQDLINMFIELNYSKLMSLTDGGNVRHLGTGGYGDAYLTSSGLVLKLEAENSFSQDHAVLESQLHEGGDFAKYYPMIYGSGELLFSGLGASGKVKWGLLEKFELIPYKYNRVFSIILDNLKLCADHNIRDINKIYEYILSINEAGDMSRHMQDIGEALRLDTSGDVPSWFIDLYNSIIGRYLASQTSKTGYDIGVSNLGLRRAAGGNKVDWIFFD